VFDLLIRGGTVVDGTGAPVRTADVAVQDGRVVEVGRVGGRAKRTIAAEGLLVTPGFIDVHTHFDGQATWDPHLSPSCWHGATTVILGNCGVGFAPVRPGAREWLIELMESVEDIPGAALLEGIAWDWQSFPQYLDALDRMPRAINVGTQLPHVALRAYVMGPRATEGATSEDLSTMHRLAVEALRAGALGVSTSRTTAHTDVHGDPVPGTFAAETEMACLLDAIRAAGHGAFELVPAGVGGGDGRDGADAMDAELDWMVRLGQATGVPITFLVVQSHLDPDGWRPWFQRARRANASGARLHPQVASRCISVLMGHQLRTNPMTYSETYRELAPLNLSDRLVRLDDPSIRARILGELAADAKVGQRGPRDRLTPAIFKEVFPLKDPPDYEPDDHESVAAMAARLGRDPWELVYDLMSGSGGKELLLRPTLNYGGGTYDDLYEMLCDPMTVQGLGDAGAHCATVCDASMTTSLLTYWTRDRTRGPRMAVESAVHRLTGAAATFYGLSDRGELVPGQRADINVIDFETLQLLYPEQTHDLPAGADRLVQKARGYVETLVSGETVVCDGELTDARPGRLVRRLPCD
jgi:N-acyl-D-aspartate/D-glutamate deacylase